MNIRRNPTLIHAPGAIASHAVEVPPNARVLHLSGQVALAIDGSSPATIEEQTELVWNRIKTILADAGMSVPDIVKITSYLVREDHYAGFAKVRARHLDGHRPASTAMIVSALVRPEFLVEVDVVAAKT